MGLNATCNLKKRLAAGEKVFGQLIGPGNDPVKTVKTLKEMGDDYLMMETEHSLMHKETVAAFIRAARDMDMPIMMRTEDKDSFFRCYLDVGMNGLMLPLVNNVEEAVRAVNKAYFPPIGHRGCAISMNPMLIDSQDLSKVPYLSLTKYINDNMAVFPQTESLENISDLSRILKIEGVTGTIVGPFDLALDIGDIDPKALLSEVVDTPAVNARLQQIVDICRETGKIAGIGGCTPKRLAYWAKQGYQLLLVGYVLDGNVEKLRPAIEEARTSIG